MKAIRWAALFLCLAIGLCGCVAPHTQIPLPTPMPTLKPTAVPVQTAEGQWMGVDSLSSPVSYNPYALPMSLRAGESFSTALYKQILDAAAAGEKEISLVEMSVAPEQVDAVRSFVLARHQNAYLSDIALEGETLSLRYSTEDAAAITKAAQEFDKAAKEILEECCRSGYTVLQCAMAAYQYLSQNVEYNYESMDEGLYGAIVNKSAIANGYAQAYAFLLDQMGIENVLAVASDGSHVWNIVTIDGASYHVDTTFDANLYQGQSMRFFGMSDRLVPAENGYFSWTCTNSVQEQPTPACLSDRFDILQAAGLSDVDYAGDAVYYDGGEETPGLYKLRLADGESECITQDAIGGLVVLDGLAYFLRQEDGFLYTYNTQSGETMQILEGTKVTSISRNDGVVYYMVDGQTEMREISP